MPNLTRHNWVTSKAQRNEKLMRFLALGIVVDEELALEGVERAEQARLSWRAEHGPVSLCDSEIKELLNTCVKDSISPYRDRALTAGVSAGFDSRALVNGMWELGTKPILFCYGQPGNIDFDVVSWLRGHISEGVFMINTDSLNFEIDKFGFLKKDSRNFTLGGGPLAKHIIDEMFPGRAHVHGFLNDALTGDNREKAAAATGDDRQDFVLRNDAFKFQQFLGVSDLDSLVPSAAVSEHRGLPLYTQYDFAYRQYSRIRPKDRKSRIDIFPYEDQRWMGYWLNTPFTDRVGQTRWLSFLKSLDAEIFSDLEGLCEEGKELRLARKRRIYGKNSKGGLVSLQEIQTEPQHNVGWSFDAFSCARNNESFRLLLERAVERIRDRGIFHKTFLDDVLREFWNGIPENRLMINGIVSLEIAIENGQIEV
jgi:hypothetical protein